MLSRAGLKLVVEGMLNGMQACAKAIAPEDVSLGKFKGPLITLPVGPLRFTLPLELYRP